MLYKQNSLKEYKARILAVINYINNNLHQKITLEQLSSEACFSPFHFHRIFTSIIGETPVDFLNRVRLEKAANILITNPSLTITQISVVCGFSSSTVFSRAFKKMFGASATAWQKKKCADENSKNSKTDSKERITISFNEDYFNNAFINNNLREQAMNVEVKILPPLHAVYYPQLDGYDEKKIGIAWNKLCNWAYPNNLVNKNSVMFGVGFDNPDITPEDKCRYYACITIAENITPPKEFGIIDLPGGKHAVVRFVGKGDEIKKAYSELYGLWLPVSGYVPCDGPAYEVYIDTPDKNKDKNFVMDICLPVKPI